MGHLMDIIHIFTTAMGKYLIGILMCVAFIFSLNEIKGETSQGLPEEISAVTYATNYVYLSSPYEAMFLNDHFSFNAFNQQICDIPHSISASIRGISFPKNLKFISTVQLLSSLATRENSRNPRNQYSHYCLEKSSNKYYLYTLRSLLI